MGVCWDEEMDGGDVEAGGVSVEEGALARGEESKRE